MEKPGHSVKFCTFGLVVCVVWQQLKLVDSMEAKMILWLATLLAVPMSGYYIRRLWKEYLPKKQYARLWTFVVGTVALNVLLIVESCRALFVL